MMFPKRHPRDNIIVAHYRLRTVHGVRALERSTLRDCVRPPSVGGDHRRSPPLMFSLSSVKSILLSKCFNRNGTPLRFNSATSRGSSIVGLISQVLYSRPIVFSFLNGSTPSLYGGITSGGAW